MLKINHLIVATICLTIFACGNKSNKNDATSNIPLPINDGIPANNVQLTPEPLDSVPFGQFAGEALRKTIAGQEYTFRWIPSGVFFMGAPDNDSDQFLVLDITDTLIKLEGPQHQVVLTSGFWMHETEVSQKQWTSLISNNPSEVLGDSLPVVNVTHSDITKSGGYLDQLHKQTISTNKFFLPTEAQWEYACRADTTTKYYWGDDNSTTEFNKYCWYENNSNDKLQSVGLKTSNPWGLKDILGNAYEVVNDFSSTYSSEGVVDPTGPTVGNIKIYRGGSFKSNGANCRSSNRIVDHIEIAYDNQGFRMIMLPD